jgi:hypothetical protein
LCLFGATCLHPFVVVISSLFNSLRRITHTVEITVFVFLFFLALLDCLFVCHGAAAQRGPWPPHSRGFLITHNDAPQSAGLLWTRLYLITCLKAPHFVILAC